MNGFAKCNSCTRLAATKNGVYVRMERSPPWLKSRGLFNTVTVGLPKVSLLDGLWVCDDEDVDACVALSSQTSSPFANKNSPLPPSLFDWFWPSISSSPTQLNDPEQSEIDSTAFGSAAPPLVEKRDRIEHAKILGGLITTIVNLAESTPTAPLSHYLFDHGVYMINVLTEDAHLLEATMEALWPLVSSDEALTRFERQLEITRMMLGNGWSYGWVQQDGEGDAEE
ncbi:hypothetical protein BJ508DRAFT_381379 [Ascobolus immersus RN42]|uniref:Uncharacterized protein n=1 Tax=Ascobolus immersus RN42 TaxID=1160509 RepID=A0A3N4HL03_ASCIM|nr:hypothetical protein BJ508DRAFT_381379 [Ascobolus immersus RN42]